MGRGFELGSCFGLEDALGPCFELDAAVRLVFCFDYVVDHFFDSLHTIVLL